MEQAQTFNGRVKEKVATINGKLVKYGLPSLILSYMLLSFILPTTRNFFYWQATTGNEVIFVLFQAMFGLTLYPILLIAIIDVYPRVKIRLDNLLHKQVVIGTGLFLLAMCFLLTLQQAPGWWWTWLTVGVQLCILLLAYLLLEKRTSPTEAVIIGIGLMGISIGLWEIPYQIGLKLFHEAYLPAQVLMYNLRREILIELPFIAGGVAILWIYHRRYKLINFSKWFWLFLGLTTGLYAYWYLSGFWVEMTYDWINYEWVQHPLDVVASTVYKASKVTLALALVSLLLVKRQRGDK